MKKVYITTIIICLMLTTMANIAKSQERQTSVHEFSAALTGGVSSFKYKLDAGSRSIGFSGGIETGYAYNFNERWGLSAGLGLSIYSSKMSLNNNFSKTYPAIDENGHSFDFTYSLSGYHEKQIVAMLYVPLMARYIIPLGAGKLKYVAAGGVKIQFPLETSIRAVINPGTVTTTGYYSYEDRTYANLPHHGFVNGRSMAQLRKDIDLSVVPMLALETGIRFPVGNNNIDLRVYFDHSLTNVRKSGDAHLVEYQSSNPSQFKYHSVVNTVLVDKVGLFGMGMKIGINF